MSSDCVLAIRELEICAKVANLSRCESHQPASTILPNERGVPHMFFQAKAPKARERFFFCC